jgi:XTP/dITP diphosphohydrolase
MRRLLIATKNAHKTAEIRAILGDAWEVTDLTEFPDIPAPDETGQTFEENARIKAEAASRVFPGVVLSDDSGLEVDPLGGAPGVDSAIYAGKHGDDAANRARLKLELRRLEVPPPWSARFRCVLALAENGRTLATFDGHVQGQVIMEERGTGGFGYDALFLPDGFQESFAELPSSTKNGLSHRGRALAKLQEFLRSHPLAENSRSTS